MSTTEAGRPTAGGKPDGGGRGGVSLQAVMESARRLDELSCARLVGDIAVAIHAVRKSGRPLAALTPSAVTVQPDGAVGLAAASAAPRYLAPETVGGGAGDRRSDVFTLGVMLWEALAHERLFGGDDDEAIRRAVLEAAVRPPSELNANVPAELDAICRRALAREPVDRYQSAKAMAADIDAVLEDAGYPESNEPIAKFVAAMATRPTRPMGSAVPRAATPPPVAPSPALAQPAHAPPPPAGHPRPATPPPVAGITPLRPVAPGSSVDPPRPPRLPYPAVQTAFLGSPWPAPPPSPTAPGAPPAKPAEAGPAEAGPVAASSSESSPRPPRLPYPAVQTAFLGSPWPAPPPSPTAPPALPKEVLPDPPAPSAVAEDALATPELPSPILELDIPPGITISPDLPPAPLRSADLEGEGEGEGDGDDDDDEFGEERHVDPEVVALHRAGLDRDVLAGWGWSADSVQAITDDDELPDTARAGRRRLAIAIGGALGVAAVIAIVAFAFSGSKPPEAQDAQIAARQATAPPVAPTGGIAEPTVAPSDEHAAPAEAPPAASITGAPARTEPLAAEPPQPRSAQVAAEPPQPRSAQVAAEPPEPRSAQVAAEPPKPRPAQVAAEPPQPRSAQVAAEPPKPRPAQVAAEPPKPRPAQVAAEPPKPRSAQVAAEPARPRPRSVAALPPEPTSKREAKTPEPRPPSAKPSSTRPRPPVRVASKAQPIDPYAPEPDKPKADPAAAYRTGLQQFARGDIAGALATFRTSLSGSPRFAPTWRGLGVVYEKLGNKARARAAFRRYLQLAPGAGDAVQVRDRLAQLGSGP